MRPKGVKILTIAFAIPGFLALLYGFSRLLTGEHSGFTIATTFGWGMSGNAEMAMIVIGLTGLTITYGFWNLRKWAFAIVVFISFANMLPGMDALVDAMSRFNLLPLIFALLQIVLSAVIVSYLIKIRRFFTKD